MGNLVSKQGEKLQGYTEIKTDTKRYNDNNTDYNQLEQRIVKLEKKNNTDDIKESFIFTTLNGNDNNNNYMYSGVFFKDDQYHKRLEITIETIEKNLHAIMDFYSIKDGKGIHNGNFSLNYVCGDLDIPCDFRIEKTGQLLFKIHLNVSVKTNPNCLILGSSKYKITQSSFKSIKFTNLSCF